VLEFLPFLIHKIIATRPLQIAIANIIIAICRKGRPAKIPITKLIDPRRLNIQEIKLKSLYVILGPINYD